MTPSLATLLTVGENTAVSGVAARAHYRTEEVVPDGAGRPPPAATAPTRHPPGPRRPRSQTRAAPRPAG